MYIWPAGFTITYSSIEPYSFLDMYPPLNISTMKNERRTTIINAPNRLTVSIFRRKRGCVGIDVLIEDVDGFGGGFISIEVD